MFGYSFTKCRDKGRTTTENVYKMKITNVMKCNIRQQPVVTNNKEGEIENNQVTKNGLKIFFVEVEAKMLTLRLYGFGQSRSTTVKHMDLSFLFLRDLLKHLQMDKLNISN